MAKGDMKVNNDRSGAYSRRSFLQKAGIGVAATVAAFQRAPGGHSKRVASKCDHVARIYVR